MKATMVSHESNMTTIRNIETHVGQIVKWLGKRQSDKISTNTKINPKEHCNTIVAEHGKIAGERDGDNVMTEKE